jgi:membrane-associated protein
MSWLIDFILHVDKHLAQFVTDHGTWVYALLFAIVFVETGFVLMPFLPGDSLLFIVGTLSGAGMLSLWGSIGLLLAAAILGDQMNYSIGRYLGPKVMGSRFFNQRAYDKAHAFYEKYGGITIVLARFMPFIRTFAPFVAGVAQMNRAAFSFYNITGGALWVISLTLAGYWFGNFPWVKEHLEKIIWGLILVPGLIAIVGMWRAGKTEAKAGGPPA